MMRTRAETATLICAVGIDTTCRTRLREAILADPSFLFQEFANCSVLLSALNDFSPMQQVSILIRFEALSEQNVPALLDLPVPIIAFGPEALMAEAFRYGCLDYLREPWSSKEFLARFGRITSVITVKVPGGTLKLRGRNLFGPGGVEPLTGVEKKLLKVLLNASGNGVSKEDLLAVGGLLEAPAALPVHISRLRKKLLMVVPRWKESSSLPIFSERKWGYRFTAL